MRCKSFLHEDVTWLPALAYTHLYANPIFWNKFKKNVSSIAEKKYTKVTSLRHQLFREVLFLFGETWRPMESGWEEKDVYGKEIWYFNRKWCVNESWRYISEFSHWSCVFCARVRNIPDRRRSIIRSCCNDVWRRPRKCDSVAVVLIGKFCNYLFWVCVFIDGFFKDLSKDISLSSKSNRIKKVK